MNNAFNEDFLDKIDMTNIKHSKVFFSNRLEALFYQLINQLFSINASPFTNRFIIVPNKEIGKWVKKTMAAHDSLGILMGCSISFLSNTLHHLGRLFLSDTHLPLFPSHSDLVHLIYGSLSNSLVPPQLLGLSSKQELPYSLIKDLVLLFKKYDLYGTPEFNAFFDKLQHWQKDLFKVPQQRFFSLDTSLHRLQEKIPQTDSIEIHLFGFAYLPKKYFDFFEKISENLPIFFYQLSPCRQFLSDQTNQRTVNFLLKKWHSLNYSSSSTKAWNTLVTEGQHPFLANLGNLIKTMRQAIENSSLPLEDHYIPSSSKNLLKHLQNDLLDLNISSHLVSDNSLQIHVTDSYLRELEAVFSHIGNLLNQGARPEEIVVITEKIHIYAPLIRSVFDTIPLRITGMKDAFSNSFFRVLHKINILETHAWDYFSLRSLLFDPAFSEKMDWSNTHKNLIAAWLETLPVAWGFDPTHRQNSFNNLDTDKQNKESTATWETLFQDLFSNFPAVSPYSLSTDPEAIQLLGEWIEILFRLYKLLEPLRKNSSETLSFWKQFFTTLAESFFVISPNDLNILNFFSNKEDTSLYSFNFLFDLLQDLAVQDGSENTINNESAVTFGSLQELHSIPYKHICLIGFDGKTIQKPDSSLPDLINEFLKTDPAPSAIELASQMFIHTLLSARETFYLSYVSSADENFETSDHRVLELKKFASLKSVIHHPSKSYSASYFSPSSPTPSFIQHHFKMAEGAAKEKRNISDFFSENGAFDPFSIEKFQPTSNKNIHIKDLRSLLLSPLNHFFHHQWGKRFQIKKLHLHPRFDLTEEELASIVIKHLGQPPNPLHLFSSSEAFASSTLKKKASSTILNSLKSLNNSILHKEPFYILFSEHESHDLRFVKEKNLLLLKLPPFVITLSNGVNIKLLGKIGPFLNYSFLLPATPSPLSLLKFWPEILLLELLNDSLLLSEPFSCLLLPNHHYFQLQQPFSAHTLMRELLHYYFLASFLPSPLIYSWLPEILKNNEQALSSVIQNTLRRLSSDKMLFWLLNFRELPSAKHILAYWNPIATSCLSPLFSKQFTIITNSDALLKKSELIHTKG